MSELGLDALNQLPEAAAREALMRCCGAQRWATTLTASRPFASMASLLVQADRVWAEMERADLLEAFSHHPRIGADINKLRAKFAATKSWSGEEQGAVASASEETLIALRDGNVRYEEVFGHIFIVCATGKSAEEMLGLLNARIDNTPDEELAIAAGEQAKITTIRLRKLVQ